MTRIFRKINNSEGHSFNEVNEFVYPFKELVEFDRLEDDANLAVIVTHGNQTSFIPWEFKIVTDTLEQGEMKRAIEHPYVLCASYDCSYRNLVDEFLPSISDDRGEYDNSEISNIINIIKDNPEYIDNVTATAEIMGYRTGMPFDYEIVHNPKNPNDTAVMIFNSHYIDANEFTTEYVTALFYNSGSYWTDGDTTIYVTSNDIRGICREICDHIKSTDFEICFSYDFREV